MSFALPSVKTKPSQLQNFNLNENSLTYGVPEVLTSGLGSARNAVDPMHPVMQSEMNYRKNQQDMNMSILRNTQGIHAPLRIAMELKAAQKVGHLPFLPSSNMMIETLTGRDIEMDATDVFNLPENREVVGFPHAVVERSLGLL